jgi:hypothetical protein
VVDASFILTQAKLKDYSLDLKIAGGRLKLSAMRFPENLL